MDTVSIVTAVALGLVLSVSTGLRAFLAPFALSFSGWMGWVDLGDTLGFLATPLASLTFGAAIVFELAADKFPAIDNVMDVMHVFIKPAAGTLVAMSVMDGIDPLLAAVASLATGGVVAAGTHVVKASVRVGSTCTTGGTCNPAISILEDVVAVGLAGLATWGVGALSAAQASL